MSIQLPEASRFRRPNSSDCLFQSRSAPASAGGSAASVGGGAIKSSLLRGAQYRRFGARPVAPTGTPRQDGIVGSETSPISFGDNVRMVPSEETTASGHAGRIGPCWGFTTPSVTGVAVVGGAPDDIALNVHFEDEAIGDAWFRPDLVQFVDHAPGARIKVGDSELVRDADGEWHTVEGPQ